MASHFRNGLLISLPEVMDHSYISNAEMIYEESGKPVTLKSGVEEHAWSFKVPPLAGTKSKKGRAYEPHDMKISMGMMFSNLVEDVDVNSLTKGGQEAEIDFISTLMKTNTYYLTNRLNEKKID